VPEFHAEAPQASVSEGLAQGPYVAAIARVEPMSSRSVDSTKAPPRLTILYVYIIYTMLYLEDKRLLEHSSFTLSNSIRLGYTDVYG